MEDVQGVVSTNKSLGAGKKLFLLLLLLGNFVVIIFAIFLTQNKPQTTTPRASEVPNTSLTFESPTTENTKSKSELYEQKLNRIRELGAEVAMSEPPVEKISIDQSLDKPSVTLQNGEAVMWTINDNDTHTLSFSDGFESPPLVRGNSYSRHIETSETVTYTDKNNSQIQGSIFIQAF